MEKKIRKEIKYSAETWNKVIELSAKKVIIPSAYIREQALNIIIKSIEDFTSDIILKWIYW